jgi:hypothetical protein
MSRSISPQADRTPSRPYLDFASYKINGLADDWRQSIPDRSELGIPLIRRGGGIYGREACCRS